MKWNGLTPNLTVQAFTCHEKALKLLIAKKKKMTPKLNYPQTIPFIGATVTAKKK